jgi:hypothetical protein
MFKAHVQNMIIIIFHTKFVCYACCLKVDTARPSPEGAQLLFLFLDTIFKCRLSRLTSYDPVRAVLFRDVVPKVLVGMPRMMMIMRYLCPLRGMNNYIE